MTYKQESLGHLEAWLNDALHSDATSKEVYDSIVTTITDEIAYHQKCLKRSKDLLLMVKGNLSAITDVKEGDYWNGGTPDEKFEEELNKNGYEYTPDIPPRY